MRVAFDAGPLLDPPTGVGRYVGELTETLASTGLSMVPYAVALKGARTAVPGLKRWRVPARAAQTVWRSLGVPSITRLTGRVDVVHATNFVLPIVKGAKAVVTVHDLSFLRDDAFPGSARLRDLVPWSLRRADRVLVPTETIGEEVAEHYGFDRDRIAVTYEGVAPRFFGASPLADTLLGKMGIAGPFVLAVGTLEPRKNLARLVSAWEKIRSEIEGWTLVIAGPRGWGEELRSTEGVVLTGWVGDETLPGLLAAASVFCYPSFYEGFGLPPLEAMAAGTPTIVGRYSCAREVLGDAAVFVDPHDEEALAQALVDLVSNRQARDVLQVSGRARAVRFTWESAAQATRAAYEDVIDG